MPVGAVIGSAVITGGAAAYSANQQGKAIKSAQKSSQAATDQVRADLEPWRTAGANALSQISNPNAILANFQADPGYQFRLNQGLDAVGTNKAVNSLLKSGSALKGYGKFAQNYATGAFGDWWNRQKSMADSGRAAAGQTIDPTMTNATNQGNAAVAGANNTSGFLGSLQDVITKYGGDIFSSGGASGSSYGGGFGGSGFSDLPTLA